MWKLFEKKETVLDAAIRETVDEYLLVADDPRKAKQVAKNLELLVKTRNSSNKSFDPSVKVALIGAGVSILGLVIVTNHEETAVIAGKAFSLLQKPRI